MTTNARLSQYEKLLRRLQLSEADEQVYLGGSGVGGVTADNRLYGGLVVAQAVVAASNTAGQLPLHSMHCYFLRPGRPDTPIYYHVSHLKQGRNYQVRQVQARQSDSQGESIIFQLMASFSSVSDGVEHADTMPVAPPPDDLPNRDQARQRPNWHDCTIDVRLCDALTAQAPLPPSKCVWLKPAARVPDVPKVHTALLAFASDRALLSTAWRPHATQGALGGVSLDHSLWIHGAIDFNEWHLYHSHSPAAAQGRGVVHGAIYQQSGRRVATVVQEGTLSYRPHSV